MDNIEYKLYIWKLQNTNEHLYNTNDKLYDKKGQLLNANGKDQILQRLTFHKNTTGKYRIQLENYTIQMENYTIQMENYTIQMEKIKYCNI
jgi:hypothetical protein